MKRVMIRPDYKIGSLNVRTQRPYFQKHGEELSLSGAVLALRVGEDFPALDHCGQLLFLQRILLLEDLESHCKATGVGVKHERSADIGQGQYWWLGDGSLQVYESFVRLFGGQLPICLRTLT